MQAALCDEQLVWLWRQQLLPDFHRTGAMRGSIAGVGVWGSGIRGWADFANQPAGVERLTVGECEPPPVTMIPPREKRRVPMMSRLAIEAGYQACEMAEIEPAGVATVFASCMADTQVTDYMCRVMNTSGKAMSPTRFHNSVHNATCGYWSIFCGGHEAGGFICSWEDSFAIAVLEAMTFVQEECKPTLMVCYDIANTAPMSSARSIESDLAVAILLAPETQGRRNISATLVFDQDDLPLQGNGRNPMSVGLNVLDSLRQPASACLDFPLSSACTLRISLAAGRVF